MSKSKSKSKSKEQELQAEIDRLRAVIRDAENCLVTFPIADAGEVYNNTMKILRNGDE